MKRALFLLLALLLVLGLAPAALAASEDDISRIDDIPGKTFYNYKGNAAIHPEQTRAGDEIIIPLRQSGFWNASNSQITWDITNPTYGPTRSQLLQNKVGVRISVLMGKDVIRDAEIVKFTPIPGGVEAQSAIRIRFVEDYVATKETEYRFIVYLTLNGKETPAQELFGGMIYNDVREIDAEDYVDIRDGTVAECRKTTDSIQVYIGDGVSVYTNMIAGEKYYGTARIVEDNAISAQYPEIDSIYRLQTINLINRASYIVFDLPVKYHVYNEQGQYLGLSNQKLPYSTRYYLSSVQLEDFQTDAALPEQSEELMVGAALARFLKIERSVD